MGSESNHLRRKADGFGEAVHVDHEAGFFQHGDGGERAFGIDHLVEEDERFLLGLAGRDEGGGAGGEQAGGLGAAGIGVRGGEFFEHHAGVVVVAGLEQIAAQDERGFRGGGLAADIVRGSTWRWRWRRWSPWRDPRCGGGPARFARRSRRRIVRARRPGCRVGLRAKDRSGVGFRQCGFGGGEPCFGHARVLRVTRQELLMAVFAAAGRAGWTGRVRVRGRRRGRCLTAGRSGAPGWWCRGIGQAEDGGVEAGGLRLVGGQRFGGFIEQPDGLVLIALQGGGLGLAERPPHRASPGSWRFP